MADKNSLEAMTPEGLSVERSPKFIGVYSNNANLTTTPFDFVITFGEVQRQPDKTFVEQTVAVTMSPQHAKALAVVLLNNVKEYEKHVGEIKLPQSEPVVHAAAAGEATPLKSR